MPLIQAVLITALLMGSVAFNEVTLTAFQGNLTAGTTVIASGESLHGAMLMAASPTSISLWKRQSNNEFAEPQLLALNNTLLDVAMDWSGKYVAAISINSTKLIVLRNMAGAYTANITLELQSQPTCLSWSYNGEILLVGLANGSIIAFGKS